MQVGSVDQFGKAVGENKQGGVFCIIAVLEEKKKMCKSVRSIPSLADEPFVFQVASVDQFGNTAVAHTQVRVFF